MPLSNGYKMPRTEPTTPASSGPDAGTPKQLKHTGAPAISESSGGSGADG